MELQYIGFIVISAFLHAFYNFLLRRTIGSEGFLFTMFMIASGIAIGILVLTGEYANIPWHYFPYVYGASFFYVVYQILVAKAYERGNISALYPLTVLSPIFIPIWAFLFLSESITILTGIGILTTVFGAICVKLQSLSLREFKKVFQLHSDYLGARFALGASFVHSFGAIFDKSRIASFSGSAYLFIIICSMTINMGLYWYFSGKKAIISPLLTHWKTGLLAGITFYLSFLFFRIALKEVFVSLAVPVRQIAIVFAIILGVLFLKEKLETKTVIGSLVIILGIILVNLGT